MRLSCFGRDGGEGRGGLKQIRLAHADASARRHRFYTSKSLAKTASSGGGGGGSVPSFVIEGDEGRHAVKALRLKEGDEIELCDGRGGSVACAICAVERGSWRVWVTPLEPPCIVEWSGPEWVLAVACLTLKGGRAEWLVEKATEIGARELVPLSTERSPMATQASKFGARAGSKSGRAQRVSSSGSSDSDGDGGGESYAVGGRLERVAVAATKQSLRAHGLLLRQPTPIVDLLADVRSADVTLLAAAGAPPAARVLAAALKEAGFSAGISGPGGGDGGGGGVQQQQAQQAPQTAHHPSGTASSSASSEADPGGRHPPQPVRARPPRVLLLIGPEGDFTPVEIEALVGAGARLVGLGGNRLRTETAALALLSLCCLTVQS
ncbi:hypothetical protein FOA52_003416 [Chlamydomonas sp. UWO 241]|nr:hypothetical protein FOA52_003416 [Chlamydomonas sp. UWO 241]